MFPSTTTPAPTSFEAALITVVWDIVKSSGKPADVIDQPTTALWYQAEFLRLYSEMLPVARKIASSR